MNSGTCTLWTPGGQKLKTFTWNAQSPRLVANMVKRLKTVLFGTVGDMRCVFKLSTQEEVSKLRVMNAAIPSNCARVYAAINVNEALLLVLERKKGVLLHNTMVSNVSELLQVEYTMADVTNVLYQCALILKDLHAKIKGFSHNDLKSDNILLTPGEVSFAVVFIDAETVRGEGLPVQFLENVDESVLSMFALDGAYCEWLDFHLILLEICFAVRKSRPPWRDAFFAMVYSFCPHDLLLTYKEGGRYVTTFNRLTAEGRSKTCEECKSLDETMRILQISLPQSAHV